MRQTISPPPNGMEPLNAPTESATPAIDNRSTAEILVKFLLMLRNAKVFDKFSNITLKIAQYTENIAQTLHDYLDDYLEKAKLCYEAQENPIYYYNLGIYYEKHDMPDEAILAYQCVPLPTRTDIADSQTLQDNNIKDISELNARFYVLTEDQLKQLPFMIEVYIKTLSHLATAYYYRGCTLERAGEFSAAIAAYQKSPRPTNFEDLYANYQKNVLDTDDKQWPSPVMVYITAQISIGFCYLQYAKQHLKFDLSEQETQTITESLTTARKYIDGICHSKVKIFEFEFEFEITSARMHILNKLSPKFMEGLTAITNHKELFETHLEKPNKERENAYANLQIRRIELLKKLEKLEKNTRYSRITENTTDDKLDQKIKNIKLLKNINPNTALNQHIYPALHEALLYLCKICRSASTPERERLSILGGSLPPKSRWLTLREQAIDHKIKKNYATAFTFYCAIVIELEITCGVPRIENLDVYYRALFNCADMLENTATTIDNKKFKEDLLEEVRQFYTQVAKKSGPITCSDKSHISLQYLAKKQLERLNLNKKTVETVASTNQLTR